MTRPKTKQDILEKSFKQFMSKSYHKVSINAICKDLELSKGAIFHYFSSKYDLACESLKLGYNKIWKPYKSELSSIAEPNERLVRFIRSSTDLVLNNPNLHRFSLEIYEEGQKRKAKNLDWMDSYTDNMGLAVSLLTECGVKNPESRARVLTAALDGLVFLTLSGSKPLENIDCEAIAQEMIDLFVP
ncbi:MAG: TetR/AcrR family transcriptional regulator [Candidatus Thorarchaeota archaeon]|jgi:AcrR family transcriptional regulator